MVAVKEIIGLEHGGLDEFSSVVGGGGGGSVSVEATIVRSGNFAVKLVGGSTGSSFAVGKTGLNLSEIWVQIPLRFSTDTSNVTLFEILDSSDGILCQLRYNSVTGKLHANSIGGTDADGTTTVNVDTWYWVDVRYKAGTGSNSILEVRLDGSIEVTVSDGTSTANADRIRCVATLNRTNYFDDIAVSDSGYLEGGQIIKKSPVTGTPTYDSWTKSTGSDAWALWDDTPFGSGDYNEATTAVAQTAHIGDFSEIGASDTIVAAKHSIVGQRTNGAATTMQLRRILGGVDTDSADISGILGTAATYAESAIFVPDSLSDLNGMEAGGVRGSGGRDFRIYDEWITVFFTPAAGGVVEADGSASGSATSSGVGQSTAGSDGSSSGVATVAAMGLAFVLAVGAITGVASVSGEGAIVREGVGVSEGISEVLGEGESTHAGVGSSSGVASISGVGQSTNEAIGESDGLATVLGIGLSEAFADGSSAGVATVLGEGQSINEGVGSSEGLATVLADSQSIATGDGLSEAQATVLGEGQSEAEAVGESQGEATVSGVGQSTVKADGDSTGEATSTGIGQSTAQAEGLSEGQATVLGESEEEDTDGVGESIGQATVLGEGQSIFQADAESDGLATISGVGQSINEGVGDSQGDATLSGIGQSINEATGDSDGVATVLGIGQSENEADGLSEGVASVDGIGESTAEAEGLSEGQASIDGIGQSIAQADGDSSGIASVEGIGQSIAEGEGLSEGQASTNGVGDSIAEAVGDSQGQATVLGESVEDNIVEADGESIGIANVIGFGQGFIEGGRFYATTDVDFNGNFYKSKIPLGAIPQVSQSVPEFFAGVEVPVQSQVVLSNLDNEFTDIRAAGGLKRSKRMIVQKAYGVMQQGMAIITPAEVYTEYRGLIDSSSIAERGNFNLLPSDIDVFDKEFPFEKVTVDLFPNAIDLDDEIPFITGTAKQVPLALVLAQESPSQVYKYLVGRGDLTVDVVYRDKLVTSTFSGTAQATTDATVDLDAADLRADDFYNNMFIEMDGEVRRITDYDGTLNRASVTPSDAWTAGAYTIRQWKKITQVINSVTYTLVEFARRQRDTSERMFQRDRMSADVTGLSTERNPSRYVETVLGFFPEVVLNASAFTTVANQIDTEGDLFVDGALVRARRVFDVLNQVCQIGRIRLRINDSGQIEPVMDGTEDTVHGRFIYNDNITEIGLPEEMPLSQLWKTLAIRYRKLFDEDDFRLTTAKHNVNITEGRVDQVLDFDLIFDKTTADKLCDYLAKRKNSFDESIPVVLNHEARGRELGELIDLDLNIPDKSGIFQIIRKNLLESGFGFSVIPEDDTIFDHDQGIEPSDTVTDSQADFRFTPANAVTNLAVVTVALPKDFKAIASITWTNPSENFTDVLVQFKKSTDSLYTSVGITTDEKMEATIETGTNYDYKVLSFNQFRDPLLVGVATLDNELSAGTSATPATPGQPTITRIFRGWQGELASYTKPSNFLRFEWQYETSGGSALGDPTTSETLKAPPLIRSGTASESIRVKVRVVGVGAGGAEVFSAYSTPSSSVSSETLLQDHITNNETSNKASFSNSAAIDLSSSTVIASVTITARGFPMDINFSCRLVDTGSQIATTLFLRRSGGAAFAHSGISALQASGTVRHMVAIIARDTPPSGSVTYEVYVDGTLTSTDADFRNLTVTEFRR